MDIAMETRVLLWDAINRYVQTCGGDPSKYVYGNTARQKAVAEVEQAIRDGALAEPERTQKTVLRAMLYDYTDHAVEKLVVYRNGRGDGDFRALDKANEAALRLQDAMADVRAGQRRPVLRADVEADYQARLAGKRPLNAPPLES